MQLSQWGIEKLIELEGLKLKQYKCSAGKDTIGVGHVITTPGYVTINGERISVKDGITKGQVIALLLEDIIPREDCVNKKITVPLTQNQFDALVIFVFNIGCGEFTTSTLRRILNQGDYAGVPAQLKRWNKVDGKVNKGLVNRRNAEITMWSAPQEEFTT